MTYDNHEYPFNIRTFTFPVDVSGSTKDNAAVKMKITVTAAPPNTDEEITAYVRKFGLEEDERWNRMTPILAGQVNTESKNAINAYDAYVLLENQEAVQKRIYDVLKTILKQQAYLNLESIQIIGRPDLPDQIEDAAASAVANQKAKQAAEADLARAKVEAEKRELEAKSFASPALLEIEKLKLLEKIELARSSGYKDFKGQSLTVIFGSNSVPQLQLKNQ